MSERHALAGRPKVYVRETISPSKAERFHASPEQVPTDLAAAYRMLREATRHDPAYGAAWKLGGTTPATRAAFKVDRVYFGPLHEREIVREPKSVSLAHLCELKGEVEIALRLSDVGATDEGAFDAWCIALEMPASAIVNLPAAGVEALIADRCAAGALILGPEHMMADRGWSEASPIVLEQDGEVLSQGGVTNLVASPIECALAFLDEARAHGFAPRAGQWVSTGGLTPCVPLAQGRHVSVRHGGVTALDFELR